MGFLVDGEPPLSAISGVSFIKTGGFKFKFKILGSECQTSGTYSKRAKQATKNDNAAACLCFLNYLAFLRLAADRAVSILPWVVSPGRSYGFLRAGSIIQKNVRKDNPTPAYSPVSDRRRLTALVEVHWARRGQAPMPQISGPNLQGGLGSIPTAASW
jgi:hypothetical protein